MILYETYEILPSKITRMFRLTLLETTLILLDAHFAIDEPNWPQVGVLISNKFSSRKRQEEVSDELASPRIAQFREETKGEKKALEKVVDKISKLDALSLPSDQNEIVQKRLLKQAVSGTDYGIHGENAAKPSFYQTYFYSLFTAIQTMKSHRYNAQESSASHDFLYIGQNRFGKHPSEKSIPKPISSGFEKQEQRTEPQNCSFNCWTPKCSARSCKKREASLGPSSTSKTGNVHVD